MASRKENRKLEKEALQRARRAKYGPRGKPAPVVVKNLATGEVQQRPQERVTGRAPFLHGKSRRVRAKQAEQYLR